MRGGTLRISFEAAPGWSEASPVGVSVKPTRCSEPGSRRRISD